MNLRWIPSLSTLGASFAVAFAVAGHRTAPPPPESAMIPREARSSGQEKISPSAVANIAVSDIRDAQLRRALANPDLVAAVHELMGNPEGDFFSPERIAWLVEALPTARMGELPQLLETFKDANRVLLVLLEAWSTRDPAAALAWADAHPLLNGNGWLALVKGWAWKDAAAALAYVEAQPVSQKGTILQTAFIEALSQEHPAQAFDLLKRKGWLTTNPEAILSLLTNWGATDPTAALAGLRTVTTELGGPNAGAFDTMLTGLLNGVFKRDAAAASALVARLSDEEFNLGKEGIAQELLARDPAATLALMSLPSSERNRKLVAEVAAKAPMLMLEHLRLVQDRELQTRLMVSAVNNIQKLDLTPPVQQMILDLLPSMPEKEQAKNRMQMARKAAASQPEWAARLWGEIPEENQLREGHQFFQDAGKASPEVAMTAFQNSSQEVQAIGLKSLCSGMAASNPRQALKLAMLQTDPELRGEATATVFAFWADQHFDDAMAALKQNLGQIDAADVLQRLPNAGRFQWKDSTSSGGPSVTKLSQEIRKLTVPTPTVQ